jgi:hypothetical protein
MSGGKGGSTTSRVEIPAWAEEAAKRNIQRADVLSQIGYVPYYGPDVAAFTPMQEASFMGTNAAAQAFGMPSVSGNVTGMPVAQDYGGIRGYSSQPVFAGAVDRLRAERPGQYAAMMAPFIDPVTGAAPVAPFGALIQDVAPGMVPGAAPSGGGGGNDGGDSDGINVFDMAMANRQRTLREPIITTAYDNFAQDAFASITDPYYDPPGTVLSRAMGIAPAPTRAAPVARTVSAPPPRPANLGQERSGSSMGSGK